MCVMRCDALIANRKCAGVEAAQLSSTERFGIR